MTPKLHQWLTKQEAVAAFRGDGSVEWASNDQFALTDAAILCFVTVSNQPDGSRVLMPSCVEWRRPYLLTPPKRFLDCWDRTVQPIVQVRSHFVFVQPEDRADFLYAQVAHLGRYGGPHSGPWTAAFTLKEKLPRDLWLLLGGFPAWSINCQHEDYRLATDDTEAFHRLLDGARQHDFWHMSLTRYEEDDLSIFTNGKRAWVSHGPRSCQTDMIAQMRGEVSHSDKTVEHFQCTCGIDLRYRLAHTVPIEAGLAAVADYFMTGQLSGHVDWYDVR